MYALMELMDLSVLTTYELWMARKRSINIRDEFLRHFNDAKEQVEEIERELRRRGADVGWPELPKLVQIRLSRVDPEEDRPPFEHFLIDTDKVEIIGRRITPYPDVDFLRKYFGRND